MMEDVRVSFYYESVELRQDQLGHPGLCDCLKKKVERCSQCPHRLQKSILTSRFFLNAKCKFLTVRCEVSQWVRWTDENDGHILILDRLTETVVCAAYLTPCLLFINPLRPKPESGRDRKLK